MFPKFNFRWPPANKNTNIAVFITDSRTCPCFYLHTLAAALPLNLLLSATRADDSSKQQIISSLKKSKSILLYAHGDESKMQFYYKSFVNNREQDIFIPNDWWKDFHGHATKAYFHTCYGSQILSSKALSGIFANWVSYSGPVHIIQSKIEAVKKINSNFYSSVSQAIQLRSSPAALKAALESIYKNIESDLYDANGKVKAHTAIIQLLGNNYNSLVCSA